MTDAPGPIVVAEHPLLAGLAEGEELSWSQSNLDFDSDHSAYEEVEASIDDGRFSLWARTDLDFLSFYWDRDAALIENDRAGILAFLDGMPGVVVDHDLTDWRRVDIWVDVTPETLDVPIESVFDVLDVVENHPAGAAFAALLEVRPGGQVIAFWDDLRAHLDGPSAPVTQDDVGSTPDT